MKGCSGPEIKISFFKDEETRDLDEKLHIRNYIETFHFLIYQWMHLTNSESQDRCKNLGYFLTGYRIKALRKQNFRAERNIRKYLV